MVSKKVFAVTAVLAFSAGAFVSEIPIPQVLAASNQVESKVGGGAPSKVLIDNDDVRVTLVSYPDGFVRTGGELRANNQLLVYIDDADISVAGAPNQSNAPRAAATPTIGPDGEAAHAPYKRGSAAWRLKGAVNPTLTVKKAYRMMFVEVKK